MVFSLPLAGKDGSKPNIILFIGDDLPTFIEAAGGEAPENIDGRSFLQVLEGGQKTHRNLIFGAHTNQGIISGEPYPVRSVRDERYKFIRNLNSEGRPTNVPTFGRNYRELEDGLWGEWRAKTKGDAEAARLLARVMTRPEEELYDLENDPWEMKNLATDPAHAETLKRLRKKLDAWMKGQEDAGMKAELAVRPHKTIVEARKRK